MIAMKLRLKTILIAHADAQQRCSEVTGIQGNAAGVHQLDLTGYPSVSRLKVANRKNVLTTGRTIECTE